MVRLEIRSHCKKEMHEEANDDEKDKFELGEKMSLQLSRIQPVETTDHYRLLDQDIFGG